ncbi:KOW domain-containing RNA-binding protein [Tissierella praeacuta]|uniref:KOW domain-containing RNA-binding protein n=1 Tax=Tissierella praeacuta TaxID=43131 RepID=UPI003342AE39
MDLSDDIAIGQVVKSRAGRDKGKVFLVLDIVDSQNVLIVDGSLRKLDNPKQKKMKHLIVYNTVLPELRYKLDNKMKINNAYIRKLLEPFNKSF